MEALEIEGQTDQTPLTCCCLDTSQRELAEAQHLFDDANHRFDSTFACSIDRFAQGGSELVGHLARGTGLLSWRIRERCETLLPAGLVGLTSCGEGRSEA